MKEIKLIEMPKILDERGNLTFIEEMRHIPFEIRRTAWLYDVPGGACRRMHKYSRADQFLIALSGSFSVKIKDGLVINLNQSHIGLYIPAQTWYQLVDFSTNSLGLILSSELFNEEDCEYEHD